MHNVFNPVMFAALWFYILIVCLSVFYVLSKIFQLMKDVAPSEWEAMGKPIIILPSAGKKAEIRLPPKMALMQYKWALVIPEWARASKPARKWFIVFRVVFMFSVFGAIGVFYNMVQMWPT